MKAVAPRVLICEKCQVCFVAEPSFYTACNCGSPLACLHGDVDLAVYDTHCPEKDCGAKLEVTERIRDIPKERR